MKKWIALVLALAFILALTGCKPDGTTDTPELGEVSGYTQERLEEKLVGLPKEELYRSWGEPVLSGFWGDIWNLSDETNQQVIIYYNGDGIVERVLVDKH